MKTEVSVTWDETQKGGTDSLSGLLIFMWSDISSRRRVGRVESRAAWLISQVMGIMSSMGRWPFLWICQKAVKTQKNYALPISLHCIISNLQPFLVFRCLNKTVCFVLQRFHQQLWLLGQNLCGWLSVGAPLEPLLHVQQINCPHILVSCLFSFNKAGFPP